MLGWDREERKRGREGEGMNKLGVEIGSWSSGSVKSDRMAPGPVTATGQRLDLSTSDGTAMGPPSPADEAFEEGASDNRLANGADRVHTSLTSLPPLHHHHHQQLQLQLQQPGISPKANPTTTTTTTTAQNRGKSGNNSGGRIKGGTDGEGDRGGVG